MYIRFLMAYSFGCFFFITFGSNFDERKIRFIDGFTPHGMCTDVSSLFSLHIIVHTCRSQYDVFYLRIEGVKSLCAALM